MVLNYQKSFAPAPQAPALSPTTQAPTPPPLKFMQDSTPLKKSQDVMLSGASGNEASREQELKLTLSRLNDLVSTGVTPEKVEEYHVLSTHAGSLVSSLPPETAKNVISRYPSDIQKAVNFGTDKIPTTSSTNPATNASMYAAIQQKEQEVRFQKQEADFNRAFKEGNFASLEGKGADSWNKLLHNDSINDSKSLNYAISKGWDINASHKNTDGTTSTYVEKQQTDFTKTVKNTHSVEAQSDKVHQMIKEADAKGDKKKAEELRKYQEQLATIQNNENKTQVKNLENTKNAVETGKLNKTELDKAEKIVQKAQEEANRLNDRAQELAKQGRKQEAEEALKHSTALSKTAQVTQKSIDNEVKRSDTERDKKRDKPNQQDSVSQSVINTPKVPQQNTSVSELPLESKVAVKPTVPKEANNQKESSSVVAPRIPGIQKNTEKSETTLVSKERIENRDIAFGTHDNTQQVSEQPAAPRRPNLLASLSSNAIKLADISTESAINKQPDKGRAA